MVALCCDRLSIAHRALYVHYFIHIKQPLVRPAPSCGRCSEAEAGSGNRRFPAERVARPPSPWSRSSHPVAGCPSASAWSRYAPATRARPARKGPWNNTPGSMGVLMPRKPLRASGTGSGRRSGRRGQDDADAACRWIRADGAPPGVGPAAHGAQEGRKREDGSPKGQDPAALSPGLGSRQPYRRARPIGRAFARL